MRLSVFFQFASLVGLLVAAAGCGKSGQGDRPSLQPVTGRVTVAGRPAGGVTISLLPTSVAGAKLIPSAVTDPDGSFRVGTFAAGDGAPEGEYAVTCVWWKAGGNADGAEVDQLKGRYTNPARAVAKIQVQPGENEAVAIDLK